MAGAGSPGWVCTRTAEIKRASDCTYKPCFCKTELLIRYRVVGLLFNSSGDSILGRLDVLISPLSFSFTFLFEREKKNPAPPPHPPPSLPAHPLFSSPHFRTRFTHKHNLGPWSTGGCTIHVHPHDLCRPHFLHPCPSFFLFFPYFGLPLL